MGLTDESSLNAMIWKYLEWCHVWKLSKRFVCGYDSISCTE